MIWLDTLRHLLQAKLHMSYEYLTVFICYTWIVNIGNFSRMQWTPVPLLLQYNLITVQSLNNIKLFNRYLNIAIQTVFIDSSFRVIMILLSHVFIRTLLTWFYNVGFFSALASGYLRQPYKILTLVSDFCIYSVYENMFLLGFVH